MRIIIESEERGGVSVTPPVESGRAEPISAGAPSEALLASVGAAPAQVTMGTPAGGTDAGPPSPDLVKAIEQAGPGVASAPQSPLAAAFSAGPAPVN